MKKSALIATIVFCLCATPFIASSAADDIFNCNTNGQATTGAGSTKPLGGPYVPVADYAVELNTGLLVYKECVLRELVTAKRKAALAALDVEILKQFNGYPSREIGKEDVFLSDRTFNRYLKNDSLNNFSDEIEGKVKNAVGQAYDYARDPRKSFQCKYTGDLNKIYEGDPDGNFWDAFDAVTDNPACSVYSASMLAYNAIEQQSAYELYKQHERLDWGQGTFDVFHYDENGFRITDTQGAIVLANGIMSVQSGYEQAKNADDLGEMTDGLYTGVSNQVLTGGTGTGSGGLSAITQALSGALSYMQQVAQNAGGTLVQQTGNFTLDLLNQALAAENAYRKIVTDEIALFTATIGTLREMEIACYTDIANAVCEAGSINATSCTAASGGGTLTFIRETKFSQKAIQDNISTIAASMDPKLRTVDTNILVINGIKTALLATPTSAQQTIAQAGLNAIVRSNATTEASNYQNYQTLMAAVLSNTEKKWKDDPNEVTEWCDTTNEAMKTKWKECWSGGSCPAAL
ncbi:MAG: hypothetical protein KBD06_05030 [Candidatus Pacebacteria bacterium]|nr:hypothetical protein [Candidatus Paceibacterota bacterium]